LSKQCQKAYFLKHKNAGRIWGHRTKWKKSYAKPHQKNIQTKVAIKV